MTRTLMNISVAAVVGLLAGCACLPIPVAESRNRGALEQPALLADGRLHTLERSRKASDIVAQLEAAEALDVRGSVYVYLAYELPRGVTSDGGPVAWLFVNDEAVGSLDYAPNGTGRIDIRLDATHALRPGANTIQVISLTARDCSASAEGPSTRFARVITTDQNGIVAPHACAETPKGDCFMIINDTWELNWRP